VSGQIVINVSSLAGKIEQSLKEYTDEIEQGLKADIKEVGEKGAEELQRISPKKTGKYASGWKFEKASEDSVIRNTKRANLTQLLEKGHAKRNGGRVKAIPHISIVEESVIKELEERTEKRIKGE